MKLHHLKGQFSIRKVVCKECYKIIRYAICFSLKLNPLCHTRSKALDMSQNTIQENWLLSNVLHIL